MIDGADDRDATRPGFPASLARAARESIDFGRADTAPALAQGRGNEHVLPFQMHKPDPRHDGGEAGCIDHIAREQLADIYQRLHGGDGGEGLAQKRARDDERLGHVETELKELRGEAKELRVGFAALRQAVIERGAGPIVWAFVVIACVALTAMCVAATYKLMAEARRIEAAP